MLDVRQAEQLVYTAASEIPALEQQIEQQENFISILLGNNPPEERAFVLSTFSREGWPRALIAYRKTQEFSRQQKLLVDAAQDATQLSHLRYSGGATSYLEVLTNDTNYFTAELGLVQAQLNEQLAQVQLYKGLIRNPLELTWIARRFQLSALCSLPDRTADSRQLRATGRQSKCAPGLGGGWQQ
jgi:outer membrane protein TolC